MTGPYAPDRVRQLRILLWVVVSAAVVMVLLAAAYLVAGSDPLPVLLALAVPGGLILGLGAKALALLSDGDPRAKIWVVGTAVVSILESVLLSTTAPGLLLGLFAVMLLLVAVLPARDAG